MGNNCENLCSTPNINQIIKPKFQVCCTTRTDCELYDKHTLQEQTQSNQHNLHKQSMATRVTEEQHNKESNTIFKYPPPQKNNNNAVILIRRSYKEADSIKQDNENEKKMDFVFVGSHGFSFGKDGKKIEEHEVFKNVSVPFKVVKLTLSPELVKNILTIFPSFFEQQKEQTWQLIKKGFYIKDVNDGNLNNRYILNSHAFYSGQYTDNPQGSAELIGKTGFYATEKFIYKGGFSRGKAHNFGELTYNSSIYRGNWERGCLINGKVQNSKYSYEGQLRQNKPHGQGTLIFHQQNIHYQGKFYKGYFNDPNGFYECSTYRYQGGFKKGKKYGFGTITIFQSDQKYKGDWGQRLKKHSSKTAIMIIKQTFYRLLLFFVKLLVCLDMRINFQQQTLKNSVEMQQPTVPSLLLNQSIRKTMDNNMQQALELLHQYPNEGIPILNNNVIRRYIQQIYQTYHLKDPFIFGKENMNNHHQNHHKLHKQYFLNFRTARPGKYKARQLKQRFLTQLQSDNTLTVRRYEKEKSPMYSYQQLLQNLSIKNQKISQTFRYCILCQNAILQRNIPYHEEKQCVGFSQLYLMTTPELKTLLSEKILTLRSKLILNLKKLQENSIYINPKAEQFIKSVDAELKGQQSQMKITDIKKWGEVYMNIVENTQKIQWFVTIFKAITQSNKRISQQTNYETTYRSDNDNQSNSIQQSTIRRKATFAYNESTIDQSLQKKNKITIFRTIADQKNF